MSKNKVVYVFHKNGANNHYKALAFLLNQHKVTLIYREFSIISMFFKSIFSFNFKLFIKQFTNLFFVFQLIFSRNKKVIIGIAPYDYKLGYLLPILRNHKLYYHTSWCCWDGSFYPKKKKNTIKNQKNWTEFLENKTQHIFCVTPQSKKSILENYSLNKNKLSVVYHSVERHFKTSNKEIKPNNYFNFIYLGRLIPQKGLIELLDIVHLEPKIILTIIGDGKLKEKILTYANNYNNIKYLGAIVDRKEIVAVLQNQQFMVLNSKKTAKWEELFGMSLIEAMACGIIPIATNHCGPKEIITPDIGFLYQEGELKQTIQKVLKLQINELKKLAENVEKKSTNYTINYIAKYWKPILE